MQRQSSRANSSRDVVIHGLGIVALVAFPRTRVTFRSHLLRNLLIIKKVGSDIEPSLELQWLLSGSQSSSCFMTSNNLSEHLTWLIATYPSTRQPPRPPHENSLTLQNSQGRQTEEPLQEAGSVRLGGCSNNGGHCVGEGQDLSEELHPPTSRLPASLQEETMTRLQSGSRAATKSCLLSQPFIETPQTSKTSQTLTSDVSRQGRGIAPHERFASGSPFLYQNSTAFANSGDHNGQFETVKRGRCHFQHPSTATSNAQFTDLTSPINLSGAEDMPHSSSSAEFFGEPRQIWREDSASRKEPVVKKGKKRNSDEFESDLKPLEDSFTAVEAFPEEAPPPYSETYEDSVYTGAFPQTTATSRQRTIASVDSQSHSLKGLQVSQKKSKITKQDLLPTVPKVSMSKEKYLREKRLSRERSKAADYEAEITNTGLRRTIADSEDEIEEQDVEALNDSMRPSEKATVYRQNHETHYPVLPRVMSSPQTHLNHTITGTHPGHEKAMNVDCSTRKPPYTTVPSDPSPFQRDSPTKLPSTQVQPAIRSDDTSSELQNAEMASFKVFLAMGLNIIENYHHCLNNDRAIAANEIYRRMEQGEQPTPEMQYQSTSLRVKIDATASLLQLRKNYDTLSQQKEELKDRLIAAIQKDRPASEYANYLSEKATVVYNMAQMERQISTLLIRAEISREERLLPALKPISDISSFAIEKNKQSTLLVQSTQAPRRLNSDGIIRECLPAISTLGTTQHVPQSQFVNLGPHTPQKQHSTNKSVIQRTPIQIYMSSPKVTDVTAYFSPSKRTAQHDFSATSDARQAHTKDLARTCSIPSSLQYRKGARTINEEEENFSRNMATPVRIMAEDEDFGQEEDDHEMLEAAEEFEKNDTKRASYGGPVQHTVLAESTGNIRRTEPRKDSTFLPNYHAQASHMQHPWSREVKAAMKERFHLRGFRPNQLEAINATLSGKDTFVLMPTGGGKSLCYQLPSIIRSGKTKGVTVVISPLLSLMHDQVEHLKKLKIQAFLINSEVTREERMLVMGSLREMHVEKFIQLLYITPEMISKSQMMINALRELYQRKKLARIVIDEAHCVSEWGHDFRPDYKLLGDVRREFSGVPVMALTATATENAKVDVVHNLGIEGCEVLTQSFNRPNLSYEIRKKGKSKEVLESIATTIKTSYENQSGIIYCLSRKNCEKVAEGLRQDHGLSAEHYHAGMDPVSKISCQKKWQSGEYHVIVATIAFGMGIDKPDVRFVIHHSIPKSLEGYYQETGRAGRDGKRSGCYLYYGYHDAVTLQHIIDEAEGSFEQKERQTQMLRHVKSFCENKSDCRRVQILRYFDEVFQREDCNRACDNCTSKSSFETQDFTDYAVIVIALVQRISHDRVTLLHCVDVFRGSKGKKIASRDHDKLPQHGAGSHLDRGDVERLFYRLLSEEALLEKNVVNKKSGFPSKYLFVSIVMSSGNYDQGLTISSLVPTIICFLGVGRRSKFKSGCHQGARKSKPQIQWRVEAQAPLYPDPNIPCQPMSLPPSKLLPGGGSSLVDLRKERTFTPIRILTTITCSAIMICLTRTRSRTILNQYVKSEYQKSRRVGTWVPQ